MEITPEEMAEKKKMVISMCICRGCPSFVECDEEIGFCFPTLVRATVSPRRRDALVADAPSIQRWV